MPTPNGLTPREILFNGPYFPSLPSTAPGALVGTIRRGSNCWRDPGGKIRVAKGLLEMSSTAVGARLFAADIQRASIAGALVGSRLPFAGLLRYENAVLLYLSENTDAQVYLDEVAVAGLTTSATAGRLRVAVPDGVGGFDVFDSGFEKPTIGDFPTTVTVGVKPVEGMVGVARARWRTSTNAIGPVSEIAYFDFVPDSGFTSRVLDVATGPDGVELATGADGWVYYGTRWDDLSGALQVVRYVYGTLPGTFTLTSADATVVGIGTTWTRDLRPFDTFSIDSASGTSVQVLSITSDTEIELTTPWAGSTGSGHIGIMDTAAAEWYDSELLDDFGERDIIRPPAAAGVIQYAGRVLIWGCYGGEGNPTGSVILPMLEDNPEHCFIRGIRTDSGGDLVNVLGADGPLYLMTTLGLELVTLTGDPNTPYNVRQIVQPGFKAATNGILFGDYFYGFNGKPLRTQASKNIDLVFAAEVLSDMEGWDPERVVIAGDPKNQAVLYIHDETVRTKVVPFMTQQEQWGSPIYFTGRFLDQAIVGGDLYVTVLDGSDITVNRWEGGAGIDGERFVASQYYDPDQLKQIRLKVLDIVGKCGSLSVYAVTPDTDPPDVGDLGAATATFALSDTSKKEPEIRTQIAGDAFAFRVDFTSNDGYLDKIVASGLSRGETR